MMSPRRKAMGNTQKFFLLFISCLILFICLVIIGYILVTQISPNKNIKIKKMQLENAIDTFNDHGFAVHLSNDKKMYTFVKKLNQTSNIETKLTFECFCKPKQTNQKHQENDD